MKHPLLPLTLALFLAACNNQLTTQTQGKIMIAPCQNLYKVETVDDLLKQFYDNIDSHCLFEMDTAELEGIWGVRVFDFFKTSPSNVWEEIDNYMKKNDDFFVSKRTLGNSVILEILYTNQYYDRYSKSLTAGQYPKYLPNPDRISALSAEVSRPVATTEQDSLPALANSVYKSFHFYWWINTSKSKDKPLLEIETGINNIPSALTLYYSSEKFFNQQ